jgi:hypothetical protein
MMLRRSPRNIFLIAILIAAFIECNLTTQKFLIAL